MRNLEKNDHVHIEIGPLKYDAGASLVRDSGSLELGKRSLFEKYNQTDSKELIDDWFSLSTVVKMASNEK
ncbi:MAG: hypothetical protein JRN15_01255 [Nitrososphaerota archaeon]|jgi:hypothetical protein|nr:hypothetical protein [Nitrososphaerota archaeon]